MWSRTVSAYPLFLIMQFLHSFAFGVYATYSMVYMVTTVGLNPFQLVFVGTVLEVSYFLLEIPTGVVADVYSRRLSIIIGYTLAGIGFGLTGMTTSFLVILLCQVIWGGGYTFLSGATEAWIADELLHEGRVPAETATANADQQTLSQIYLRGSQFGYIGALLGIGISLLLAQVTLALPLVVGGALFILLAIGLALLMPEAGFTRTPATERESWRALFATAHSGLRTVRGEPILVTILVITAFVGAWSESFDRLWTKHLIDNFTLPVLTLPAVGTLDWVAWFALLQAVGLLLSLGVAELTRRYLDMASQRVLIGTLTAITMLLMGGALLFAGAAWFGTALVAYWLIGVARSISRPLFTGWINQYLSTNVRATVLSIHGQSDALGQVIGGPVIGLLGTWGTLRLALRAGSALLVPAMLLYGHLLYGSRRGQTASQHGQIASQRGQIASQRGQIESAAGRESSSTVD